VKPIALVPAKGKSERLPNKNRVLLGGKPLLAWTVEAAQAAGIFERIVVSTENEMVARMADELGADTLQRPRELAEPNATVSHVIAHARDLLAWAGPIYVLLPSSPFRRAMTIAAVWDRFDRKAMAGAVMSLRPVEHPPEWMFWRQPMTGALTPLSPLGVDLPRSALTQAWRHDGSHFLIGGEGRDGPPMGFEVDAIEATDINTPEDLDYAEFLLERGQVPWILNSAPRN
jgi:CMP-N-acetylneuraminic acid synthetase